MEAILVRIHVYCMVKSGNPTWKTAKKVGVRYDAYFAFNEYQNRGLRRLMLVASFRLNALAILLSKMP